MFSSASSITVGEGVSLESTEGDVVLRVNAYLAPSIVNDLQKFYNSNVSNASITIGDNVNLWSETGNVYIATSSTTSRRVTKSPLRFDIFTGSPLRSNFTSWTILTSSAPLPDVVAFTAACMRLM